MDFNITPEQEALTDSVRRFIEREYDFEKRKAILRSPAGRDPAHWATFAELGLLGAGLAEEAGGFGGGPVENMLIAQEFGKALVTEPFAAHVVVTKLLSSLDTPRSVELIEQLVMGAQQIALAVQEPQARGDFSQVEAHASPAGSGWSIEGRKSLVEGAASADMILVPAMTDRGLGLFLLDPAAPGLARTDYRTVDNRRASDLVLSNMQVPQDALLAVGTDVEAVLDAAVDYGLIALCGEALGIMEAALWQTRDYLKTRKQFGVHLGSFQTLQHRMADMLVEAELMRSILFHAVGAVEDKNADARRVAVSGAKVQAAKGGLFVTRQAIQLHGGIGVTDELIISHYYRRLFVIARQWGDMEFHLSRFASARDRSVLCG